MEIRHSVLCDIGKVREENQDSIYTGIGNGWGIFVVADGMGGHTEGAKASRIITDMFRVWAQEKNKDFITSNVVNLFAELRKTLEKANAYIIKETEAGKLCGSTAVALLIIEDNYLLVSVGDSRCYEVQKKIYKSALQQMTHDEIVDIPGDEYGKLTNAVGIRFPLRCNIISGRLKKQHIFLLCTDGVYKFCNEKELLAIIKHTKRGCLDKTMQEIKHLVYERGAKDNLSAIVVTVER